jgi:hypothetical protein
MIAPGRTETPTRKTIKLQEEFLAMLPQIRRQAQIAFRERDAESREDLVQEVIANSFCAFARLVSQGREEVASPWSLAEYAIRHVHAGRRVGSHLSCRDVLSTHARRLRGLRIERLDRFDDQEGVWQEVLVESRNAGPAETAASRIDVQAWFGSLSSRNRRIAEMLATGEKTGIVAEKFGLSAARVSQLRSLLRKSWERLQEEDSPGPVDCVGVQRCC